MSKFIGIKNTLIPVDKIDYFNFYVGGLEFGIEIYITDRERPVEVCFETVEDLNANFIKIQEVLNMNSRHDLLIEE